MRLCLRFPSLVLYKRILNSPCFLILLIHTKYKAIRWIFGLTPRFYSLEGELTQYVDKAKNVWLIVGQLHIKAGWWDAPLALQDFSWSNEHSLYLYQYWFPNSFSYYAESDTRRSVTDFSFSHRILMLILKGYTHGPSVSMQIIQTTAFQLLKNSFTIKFELKFSNFQFKLLI